MQGVVQPPLIPGAKSPIMNLRAGCQLHVNLVKEFAAPLKSLAAHNLENHANVIGNENIHK